MAENDDVKQGGEAGEAAQPTNWRDALPEQLRDAPFLNKADKPLEQVIADLTNAAGHMGNSIRIPGPDADDEAIAKFRSQAVEKIPGLMAVPDPDSDDYVATLQKLGMPEAADKYKVPEDCPIEGEDLGRLMAEAHKHGLTQKQFAGQLGDLIAQVNDAKERQQLQADEQRAILKGEWGEAFDDRSAAVDQFLAEAPEALRNMPKDAETMRWLYGLAESFNEGNEAARQADGGRATLTPGEALEQANEVLMRLKDMRRVDNPQLYDQLMNKRIDLLRKAS
jgi:hypothetical protein